MGPSTVVERFDISTHEVQLLPPLPQSAGECGAFWINNILHVLGGYNEDDDIDGDNASTTSDQVLTTCTNLALPQEGAV